MPLVVPIATNVDMVFSIDRMRSPGGSVSAMSATAILGVPDSVTRVNSATSLCAPASPAPRTNVDDSEKQRQFQPGVGWVYLSCVMRSATVEPDVESTSNT